MKLLLLATFLLTFTYEQIDSLLREYRKEHPVPEHYREQLQWSDPDIAAEKEDKRR
ncbi:MAG: hypothetical protein KDD02_07815 [Phaeodactylibacter sp.]|nr:hypothetical protein [Phaeodactylibacter sp.]MCB9302645.1 hypothetical protein [Lewinellaceae bacterium]